MNTFIKYTSYLLLIVFAVIVFGCASSGQLSEIKNSNLSVVPSATPQTEMPITDDDKKQIIVEVLRQENSRDVKEKQKKNTQNTIYILDGNLPLKQIPTLPLKQIPKIEGVEVTSITQAEIETKKQSEIVYYEFRNFSVKDSKVVIPIIWNKRDSSSGHSAIIEYECEKISGKWKVEGKITGVSVAESH